MNLIKMGDISKLVVAFVLVLVGTVLLSQISIQANTATSRVSSTETFNVTPARADNDGAKINSSHVFTPAKATEAASGWRQDIPGCTVSDVMTSMTLANATGTAYTLNTDYIVTAGTFNLENTAKVNGSTNFTTGTFESCPTGYVGGWTATTLLLIPGFFALALMGIGVGLFYMIAREHGIF
jgi:hypothetical protein